MGALMRLEPCAAKVAYTVLRGESGSNATPLPDNEKDIIQLIIT